MGFFSGLGRRLQSGWNDGSLMNSLQMAGATAQGNHGVAAQIGNAYQDRRAQGEERQDALRRAEAEAQAAEQQRAAVEAALVARGVPADQAGALSHTSQGASVLASYNDQQAPDAVDRLLNSRTPEEANARRFAMGQALTGDGSLVLPDVQTNIERQQQTAQPPVLGSIVDYSNAAEVLMQGGTVAFNQMVDSGAVVRVTSPEQARRLPVGTRILLPDGTIGVVQ